MTDIDAFLRLIDAYAAATGRSDATVGKAVFNDGKAIARLRKGGDVGTRKLREKLIWLSEHWPPDTPWPGEIPRPATGERHSAALVGAS